MAALICRQVLNRITRFPVAQQNKCLSSFLMAKWNVDNNIGSPAYHVDFKKHCFYGSFIKHVNLNSIKFYCTKKIEEQTNEKVKLSITQRFKQMYRDYWYVLVPVHLITSVFWTGGLYYLASSGIDIVAIMENWNVSETIIHPLRDSSMGQIALTYALYKIASPLRYTVTLGGTTVSINYLQKWGYIKPVPSREKLKEMYLEKKENLLHSVKDKREDLKLKKEQLIDKTDNLLGNVEKQIMTKMKDSQEQHTNKKAAIQKLGISIKTEKKET